MLPDELTVRKGSKDKVDTRRGKGRRRHSGDAKTEKRRLDVFQLPDAVHEGPDGKPCHHLLAAIDTCLVVHDGGSDTDWWHRTEVPPRPRVERTANPVGTWTMDGVWRLRCEHMDPANRYFEHRIELSGTIGSAATAKRLNAHPYLHLDSSGIYGWRNDIESFFQWLKRQSTWFGVATSLRYDDFILDVHAAGVLSNAVAHDLHAVPMRPTRRSR